MTREATLRRIINATADADDLPFAKMVHQLAVEELARSLDDQKRDTTSSLTRVS